MSGAFPKFLAFLVLLAVVLGVGAWWVGPGVVGIVLDETRRQAPYYVIHGEQQRPEGAADGSRPQALNALAREEQGQLLWRGGLAAMHEGRLADELADLRVFEFPSGRDVVQMLTSAEYRRLAENTAPLLLGASQPPAALAQDEHLLVWLLEADPESWQDAALDPVLATATAHGGQVVWQAPLDVIGADSGWNRLVMIAFPDPGGPRAWLEDPLTNTERVLARRYYTDEALLEFSGSLNSG